MDETQFVTLKYFAWMRERIGKAEEKKMLPSHIHNVNGLIEWLITCGEGYALAFEQKESVKVALDQQHASHDSSLNDAREIAFFPPMTGG